MFLEEAQLLHQIADDLFLLFKEGLKIIAAVVDIDPTVACAHFFPLGGGVHLHDRVLVRRTESEEKTSGGLIIPDSAKEKPSEGEIVAAGPGARKDSGELIDMAVKEGDKILFGKWSGTEVTVDGEELLMMKESDILGIIA